MLEEDETRNTGISRASQQQPCVASVLLFVLFVKLNAFRIPNRTGGVA